MNRKLLRLLISFALFPVLVAHLHAQTSSCEYTLIMNDSYGDGWNGGTLTVTSGTETSVFTLATGTTDTVTFSVIDGAPLSFSWVQGSFLTEVSYTILNNVGAVVSQAISPNMPVTGTLYTGIGDCVTCAPPTNFRVENVWDTYVKLRWGTDATGPNPAVGYRVIYGLQGFTPATAGSGDTIYTTTTKATINGLQKKTWYDAYIQQDCGAPGGFSNLSGPISFQTYWTNDLGITGVVSPASGCDLGLDTVRILMKNFGSAPQTLIPFRYTVNGEEVGISKPSDGVYTGVLGKDSVETIAFETLYDFSDPGEYVIVVYTKMQGDEDVSNDTFTYYLNNRLLSPYNQNFETWNGGWKTYSDSPTNSWAFGTPNKPGFTGAASGQNAWVTNLTGSYLSLEKSYLESPCFDFSDLAFDPAITFSLDKSIEPGYDAAWLEVSVDGGNTWNKVGGLDEGINWYNEDVQSGTAAGEAWSGQSDGWVYTRHTLNNVAGESEVHVRFVFAADISLQIGGLGVDDVRIFPSFNKDMAGKAVQALSETEECGLQQDKVTFVFTNVGAIAQSNVQVAYSINGGTPVVETVSGSVAPDQQKIYTFSAPFDSRDAVSVIKCWTKLSGELAPANDTATLVISHVPYPVPVHENFESQLLQQGWLTDGYITNGHGNTSYVLATNLYSFNPESTLELPRYGIIGANDSLSFTYRLVNYSGGTPYAIPLGSTFELQISTDCGETYQTVNTINSINHSATAVMRTRKVSLSQFAGQSIKIRFAGTWVSGDFWFDVDNINMLSCAADMQITADITPTTPGLSTGEATVNVGLGNPPYTYAWSNGATAATATGLAAGAYTVTVTDDFGCTDTFEFSLGSTGTSDIDALTAFTLSPNPTTGWATLKAAFSQPVNEVQLEVINLLGQVLVEANASNTTAFTQAVDLSQFPTGLYLVRLTADGQVATKKLVKE